MNMKLYDVHEEALKYYKNILQSKNKYREVTINKDILIRRITAMCYAGIKIDCKNKKGIKKIYCNGMKITVDWNNHFVKYIALINLSNDDFCESNKKLLDASMKDSILKKLSDNYKELGLNSLGLVMAKETKREVEYLTEEEKVEKYAYNTFLDVRHKCESEYITDPMLALHLCQMIYEVANKRRQVKADTLGEVSSERVYITRVLNNELGNTINW